MGLLFIFILLQVVNSQYGLDCDDCAVAVGAGTANSGDMYNPWAISYHLIQPKFQLQFTTGLVYTQVIDGLTRPCKTGYVYDFGSIASSPIPVAIVNAGNNLITFPFYAFPVVFTYNLPEINPLYNTLTFSQNLTFKIFNLIVLRWNDQAIKDENPIVANQLPDQPIILILRSDATPLTKAISKTWNRFNKTLWPLAIGSTNFPTNSPILNYTKYGAIWQSNTFSATSAVYSTNYSLGYAPQSFVQSAGLPVATVTNLAGNLVNPTFATIQEAIRNTWSPTLGYNYSLDPFDRPGAGSYPYTLVSWLMIHKVRNLECGVRREFFKFLNWAYTDRKALGEMSGTGGQFSPLTEDVRLYVISQLSNLTCQNKGLLALEFQGTTVAGLRSSMMVVTSAFISFSVTIMAALLFTKNSRVTKAAGLAFASAFLMGCILNYVSVFFWAFEPTATIICRSRVVFMVLGYTLLLGAMFSKSWEVSKIFQRVEKGDISPFQEVPWWKFCRVFFIIFHIQIVFLIALMIADPPQLDSYIVDPLNLIAVQSCTVKHGSVWFGLEGAFFGILSVWGAYLAYQTRLVWQRYKYPNESRSILLSLYNLLLAAVLLIPFFSIMDPTEDLIFGLVCFAILYPTGFCLAMVYVPKLASFLGSRSKRSKESHAKSSERGSVGGSRTAKRTHHDDESGTTKRGQSHHDDDSRIGIKSKKEERSPTIPEEMPLNTPTSGTVDTPRKSPHQEPETPANIRRGLPALHTPVGDWRVLVNPLANENPEVSVSVFDSPEAAAQSNLLGRTQPVTTSKK